MNKRVSHLFARLQGDLKQLLAELDNVSNDKLEKSPGEGKWSVTQVMYHLNSAESLSVKYVSKKRLASPQLKRTGIEAQLRLLLARISFYVPFKYRAPKLLGEMPEHVSYVEIKNAWLKTRSELSELLHSLKEEELNKPIFRQPFFGRWNIFQMLGFMQTHFNRHRRQINKTLKML
jgi:hypothetical protein